jgi:sortase A
MREMRILCMVVLVAGGALTARAAYLHAKAGLAGALIRRAWNESVRTGEAKKPWRWADMHPTARLRIPRLNYDEYVLDNAAPRTLAFGPGLVQNGAELGRSRNVVLAGHRTSWFLPLGKIARGDRIEIEWFDVKRESLREKAYIVEKIAVVEPTDVSLLEPSEEDTLTLVTCYPFGYGAGSPQRFVVRAVPVDKATESTQVEK